MDYHKNKPVYVQIMEAIVQKIVVKEWTEETKIPTIKNLALEFDVNHNTLMRSLEFLQNRRILFSRRGVGLFLKEESYRNALEWMRNNFYEQQVPDFFANMHTLKITLGEMIDLYKLHKNKINN